MNEIAIVAQGGAPTPTSKPAPGPMDFISSPIFPLMIGLLILYFFMMRGNKGKEKQRQDMLKQLKRNDEVQTIGGVIGRVIEVRDDRVQVKVDENTQTKVWFSRSAIHRVLDAEKSEAK
ncbi:MAG TPA: preprotein translocase subunit YajC [Tepidisphaeraceae bacterium]|nr:preprotein translocase subunit YajC [Tepidisphaeraceae bacterium]